MSNRERTASDDLARRVLASAQQDSLDTLLLREPLVVGVSGGTDSLALLHLLVALRGDSAANTLHVAHLDHGFRGAAGAADACFVEQIAHDWAISCTVASFDVPAYARRHNLSAEEAARLVRYSFMADVARQREATVTVAHNADDQAETVLMHILRGTGLSGLAGMQPLREVPARPFESLLAHDHPGNSTPVPIYRPLLHIWREELAAYCEQHSLEPCVDATNSDLSYRRNRIRHELIPYLTKEYSPAVKAHLTDLAELAGADDCLIKQVADAKWEEIAKVDEQAGLVLFNTAETANLPKGLRRRMARKALGLLGGTLDGFTFEHVRMLVQLMSSNREPKSVQLPHGLSAERLGDQMVLRRNSSEAESILHREALGRWPQMAITGEWPLTDGKVEMVGGWKLKMTTSQARTGRCLLGDYTAAFDADSLARLGPVVWRRRRAGDFIEPLGMQGRKSLQELLVDAKIPRRVRDMIPLLAVAGGAGEILWVPGPGGRRSRHAALTEETVQLLCLQFRREGA